MAMVLRRWLALCALIGLLLGCAGGGAPVREASTGEPVRSGSHLVKRGDTLWGIAFQYGWEVKALARRNGISPPYTIRPGQRIRLDAGPVVATTPAPAKPAPASPAAASRPPSAPPATQLPRPAPAAAQPRGGQPVVWQWPLADAGKGARRTKNGLDLPVASRQPVRSVADGTVVYAGDGLREYGNLVIVRHGGGYLSAYGRLLRIRVREGKTIKAGAVLADTGPDGDGSPGALHFEIRREGQPVDPRSLLP